MKKLYEKYMENKKMYWDKYWEETEKLKIELKKELEKWIWKKTKSEIIRMIEMQSALRFVPEHVFYFYMTK
jgi:hypothetical protein